jgi:hypothetical protein
VCVVECVWAGGGGQPGKANMCALAASVTQAECSALPTPSPFNDYCVLITTRAYGPLTCTVVHQVPRWRYLLTLSSSETLYPGLQTGGHTNWAWLGVVPYSCLAVTAMEGPLCKLWAVHSSTTR